MSTPVIDQLQQELGKFNERQLWALLELVLHEMQQRELFEGENKSASELQRTATRLKLVEP